MMRIHVSIVLAVSLASCISGSPAATDVVRSEKSATIDALFSNFNKDTPGCAVAVDYQGVLVHMDGYGMADLEQSVPIKPNSVFYAGSVSKQVVAMTAMLLDRDGKIDLDAKVGSYLPEQPDYADKITIRQLLHHTSGIRDFFELLRLAGRFDGMVVTEDMILDILAQQEELNFTPGEHYAYSNSAYFLVSQIVEKIEGVPLDDFAQANIFKPLGMKHSHFQHDHRRLISSKAHGYIPSLGGGYMQADVTLDVVGSGGMYTTVYDLILWDRNFYDNALSSGRDIIEEMQISAMLNSGDLTDTGIGLKLKPYRGLRQVSHSGSLAGYRARLQRFPDQEFTVAILCNSAVANPTIMANQITDIYLKEHLAPKVSGKRQKPQAANDITYKHEPSKLVKYAGAYYSREVDNTLTIDIAKSGLQITGIDGLQSNLLLSIGEDTFGHPIKKFQLVFEKQTDGQVSALVFNGARASGVKFVKKP